MILELPVEVRREVASWLRTRGDELARLASEEYDTGRYENGGSVEAQADTLFQAANDLVPEDPIQPLSQYGSRLIRRAEQIVLQHKT